MEISVFDELTNKFSEESLGHKEKQQLKKFMLLFFLGHLMDLPTLHSILEAHDIRSNSVSKQFKQLYKKLTINKLLLIFESVFESQIYEQLKELSEKDSSCWSRELVTVVLDDSVFKQWLSSFQFGQNYEGCYGKFFSGQTRSSVYGFKNACLGVVIDGVYYPMYNELVKKIKKADNNGIAAPIEAAQNLINRFSQWKKNSKVKELGLPALHFSCDSGYSDPLLAACCEQANLIYISVPKKSHLFEINGQKINLKNWTEQEYLKAEQEYLEQQAKLPKEEQKPFTFRFKAFYCCKNMDLTLLAFRLNGSKKVSIIYCTSKTIFAKTLRRHWFQRTYIEQFFKILKHMLHIQESRTRNKDEFFFKFLRFAYLGLHIQKLIKFIRKKMNHFDNKGFIYIQRILRKSNVFDDLLQKQIRVMY